MVANSSATGFGVVVPPIVTVPAVPPKMASEFWPHALELDPVESPQLVVPADGLQVPLPPTALPVPPDPFHHWPAATTKFTWLLVVVSIANRLWAGVVPRAMLPDSVPR